MAKTNRWIDSQVGRRFGSLVVMEAVTKRRQSGGVRGAAKVKCDCGVVKTVDDYSLKIGKTTSCNQGKCKANFIHGMSRSTEHSIWQTMLARCYNKNNQSYKNYGARGVRVCEEWHKFENFYRDMGSRPKGMSLDRINNNGNYEKGNCRWATQKTQSNNTRRNVYIEFNGKVKTRSQWAESLGITNQSLYLRLTKHKWPLERALTQGKMEGVKEANKAWKSRTHCKRGHKFSGGNVKLDRNGNRICMACAKLRSRARRDPELKARLGSSSEWNRRFEGK